MRHRIVSRTTVMAAVCGFIGLAGLAGCDSGGDPTTSATPTPAPPSSTSTTTSSSPASSSSTSAAYVPVKPQFPAAAKKQTFKSAETFVAYYFQLLNYAFSKPESGLVGELSLPQCDQCAMYEENTRDLITSGQRYSTALVRAKTVSFSTEDLDNPWVIFNGIQLKTDIVDQSGGVVESVSEEKVNLRVVLRWTQSGWRVEDLVSV